MDNLIRLLLRFLLVPLGCFAAVIAGTLVVMIASWQELVVKLALSGHPDALVFTAYGLLLAGSLLLPFVIGVMLPPASIGILISEAFAIRSWMFHALNGAVSVWLGRTLYHAAAGGVMSIEPVVIVAAGIAGGFAYWGVAGFSAGFWKPVFRRDPPPAVPATTR